MNLSVVIGWFGVAAYLIAYICLSFGLLKSEKNGYHVLNAIGGICLVVNAYNLTDVPALVVNLAWIVIATISIIRISRIKRTV